MIFARIDVELRDHEKAQQAGQAMATWTWALLWTRAKERDGFVSESSLRGAWSGEKQSRKDMGKLVACGLARKTNGGWQLRHFRRLRPRVRGALRERVVARCGLTCGICGAPVPSDDVHIDHIVALANGGPHEEANMQVAHSLCNKRKGAS